MKNSHFETVSSSSDSNKLKQQQRRRQLNVLSSRSTITTADIVPLYTTAATWKTTTMPTIHSAL